MSNTESTPVKWAARLSNGESLVEGHGKVAVVPGEDSPWHKFRKYLKDNDLKITSFQLINGDRHYNLPKAYDYNCFRYVEMCLSSKEEKHYICAQAIYGDCRLEVWVDLNDTNKVWFKLKEEEDE